MYLYPGHPEGPGIDGELEGELWNDWPALLVVEAETRELVPVLEADVDDDNDTFSPKQARYSDSSISSSSELKRSRTHMFCSKRVLSCSSMMTVASGTADDVRVLIDVTPLPEHVDLVEHAVIKEVVRLPDKKAVPLQSWIAVGLQDHVVAVTLVTSIPEQADVVRQD